MKITHLPEDGKNFFPYEVSGKTIDFDDGELMFNVSKVLNMLQRSLFRHGNIRKWKKKIRTMIQRMKREPNSLLSKS